MNDKKILAILWNVLERIDNCQYVESIALDNNALLVEYKSGFKQEFPLPKPQLIPITSKDQENKENTFKEELSNAIDNLRKDLSSKLVREITALKDSIVIPEPLSGKDGRDGRDADENKIIEELDKIIESRAGEIVEAIKRDLPQAKDGADGKDGKNADEKAITDRVLSFVDGKVKEEVENLKATAIKLFDREDLRSQVGAVIDQYIEQHKLGLEKKDFDLEDSIRNQIIAFKNEVIKDFKDNIDILADTIATLDNKVDLFPSTIKNGKDGQNGRDADEELILSTLEAKLGNLVQNNYIYLELRVREEIENAVKNLPKPKDGRDGIDGKDAESAAIVENLEKYIENKLKASLFQIKEELSNYCAKLASQIQESVVPVKGEKGEQGKEGKQGERGNGIIEVKIDNKDHLIVTTDDRIIDAGKIKGKDEFYVGVGGSSYKYTNTAPTPFSLGGYEKGTRFFEVDERVLWTKLLYGWDLPEFSAFIVNNIPSDVEVGYSIQAGDYIADFTIVNPELLKEDSITILADNIEVLSNLPNVSPVTITLPGYRLESLGSINFQIYAYDTTGVSLLKDYICNYKYKIYYGEYTEDITDTGFANPFSVLRATELVDDIKGEYLFLDIGYKWFCYPEILGENYIFFDMESDISLVFADTKKITITNEYGVTITYNCLRSFNEIHNTFVMGVK